MNDLLLDLSPDTQATLAAALERGYLDLDASPLRLRAQLGDRIEAERLSTALQELKTLEMSPRAAAAALRAVQRVRARQRTPDLVLSGQHIPGIFARDTGVVYDELLGAAERSIWLSSFVYHNGPKVFETLARRMDAQPALTVKLLLNIQRPWGNTSKSEYLISAFAHTLWHTAWPGQRRPQVYFDPRALELADAEQTSKTGRAVLHAKVAVVDDEALFVTSANLTEAASARNIEIGVLIRDRGMALTVVTYFQRLIDTGHLELLPG